MMRGKSQAQAIKSPKLQPQETLTKPRQGWTCSNADQQSYIISNENGSCTSVNRFNSCLNSNSVTMQSVTYQDNDINETMMSEVDAVSNPLQICDRSHEEENVSGNVEVRKCTSWRTNIRKISKKYRSFILENKQSVARDHLALERTFLAWLRTSLAFASIGITFTQLFRLDPVSNGSPVQKVSNMYVSSSANKRIHMVGKPLGIAFLSISMITLLLGFNRYFESQQLIIQGKFPASRGSIILMAAITFTMIITSLLLISVLGPRMK